MFGLFRKKDEPVGGEIAYFGLSDWWLFEFTEEERNLIRDAYQPLGSTGYALDKGEIGYTTQNVVGFTSNLAGWFNREDTRHIAFKFIRKADEYDQTDIAPMTLHFAMQARCQLFYKWRDHDQGALEEAIAACERSIAISDEAAAAFAAQWGKVDVSHYCFRQLAIIEEKRDNIERAISLCNLAKTDGWLGDWNARLDRLNRKLARTK